MTNIYFWGKPISPSFTNQTHKTQNHIKTIHCAQLIQKVQCGVESTFLLTSNNQLYAFGSNQQGQIGLQYSPHKNLQICRILVPTKRKIVSISCGWFHTLILDQIGDLYSTGSGQEGAVGNGTRYNSYGFKLIMNTVKKISAGRDHSLAIKGNKVFGWGNTQQGQLGLRSKKVFLSPKQLNVYPCRDVFAGAKFSILVTQKGVYVCGLNNNYQLGLGHEKDLHYPKFLNLQDQIVQVWGKGYCFAKNKHNQIYIWGCGAFGIYKYPTKIPFFQGCQNISVGLNFGVVRKSQKVYVWGSNRNGQLGTNDLQSKQYAYECPALTKLNLQTYSCGSNYTVGISYGEPIAFTQKVMTEVGKDYVKEEFQQNQNLSEQNVFSISKNSFYSSSPKFRNQNCLCQQYQGGHKKLQMNNNLLFYNINKHKNSGFAQYSPSNSQKSKSVSGQTVKKILLGKQYNAKKCLGSQNTNISKIDTLAQGLQQLKGQFCKKNLKDKSLFQENHALKQMLKEQILKQALQQNNYASDTYECNLKLKNKVKQQEIQLQNLRKQYSSISNLVQNHALLSNLLGLKDESYQCSKSQDNKDEQIQQFGQKLYLLKKVLEQSLQA